VSCSAGPHPLGSPIRQTAVNWILVGLGYGDEGKGSQVDALTRETGARWNVRFNGGPQAAHHVVTPEGTLHCFSQVGSGSFVPGVRTWLSHFMQVDPLALERELETLEGKGIGDIASRVGIDPGCPIVTPWHAWLNRMRETVRGAAAHGTCGRGAGELLADLLHNGEVLRAADLTSRTLPAKLARIRDAKLSQMEALCMENPNLAALFREASTLEVADFLAERYRTVIRRGVTVEGMERLAAALRTGEHAIFEGAQGALLDMEQGFFPHVTPSRTTAANARLLLAEMEAPEPAFSLGVMRSYLTRHGAGPLVTEDPKLLLPEPHNPDEGWQGAMRRGWFDSVAIRYAISINEGVDRLALTCVDQIEGIGNIRLCDAYLAQDEGGEFARWDGESVTELKPLPPEGGTYAAERRTRWLSSCLPSYQDARSAEPLPERIGDLLGQPVDRVSSGPSAFDQRWRTVKSRF